MLSGSMIAAIAGLMIIIRRISNSNDLIFADWSSNGIYDPRVFVVATCRGVMNQSQLAYAQSMLAGSSFTFATPRENS